MNNTSDSANTTVMQDWLFRDLSFRQIASRAAFFVLIAVSLVIGSLCFLDAFRWINTPFPGFLYNERMVVGHFGQYHWTGTEAGLKYPHKILEANSTPVASRVDLNSIISDAGSGIPVRYLVSENGRQFEISIPSMKFTLEDFLVTFGIIFFEGGIYLILGIIVFILKPDSKVSWIFLTACFLQGIASMGAFDIESTHRGFVRVLFITDSLLSAVIIHLTFLFPEKLKLGEKHPFLKTIPYGLSLIFIMLLETLYPDPKFLTVNTLMLAYMNIAVLIFMAGILYSYLKKSSLLARQRAKVILLGSIVALPIPTLFPFIASTGGTLAGTRIITNFLSIPLLILPFAVAYAISKHNLFDVDVYIKRAVGYGLMTAIVGIVYFLLQLFTRNILIGPVFGEYAENIYPVVFALLVVFLFNPVNKRVQTVVDRFFYRKKFDYKDTVLAVSNALTSVLNIDEIVKRIISTLKSEMFIDRAGIILLEQRSECKALFVSDSVGDSESSVSEQCLMLDDPLITLMKNEKSLITVYDIEESPRYVNVKNACSERFHDLGATLTLPFTYRDEVVGVLALGNKKSGHFYSRDDIHLLETLSNQGAVAIKNARYAEQMKQEETVRTNLSRYLSPQIVDQVVKNNVQVNLGGDRKEVTVLFSDIRNFTTITETRPADQLVHILNEYFTEMAKIIFENQGSLDKYIGDALVAVFGSLVNVENPAQNAVEASIQMMKKLLDLNRHWTEEFDFSMDIGIGVTTGEVFLGNIGSPERMEFTVIGDTVNVASRFSGLAKAGQILVTRETFSHLQKEIRYAEHPPSEVKGKTGKLEVFEILY